MCRTDEKDESNEGALLPVDHLALPLTGDHVQQRLPEVVPDAAVADHLVPEDDEAQVVDVLHIVLLNVHSVLGVRGGGVMFQTPQHVPDQNAGQPLDGRDSAALKPGGRSQAAHHVHEDVSDHHHGRLMVVPCLV